MRSLCALPLFLAQSFRWLSLFAVQFDDDDLCFPSRAILRLTFGALHHCCGRFWNTGGMFYVPRMWKKSTVATTAIASFWWSYESGFVLCRTMEYLSQSEYIRQRRLGLPELKVDLKKPDNGRTVCIT